MDLIKAKIVKLFNPLIFLSEKEERKKIKKKKKIEIMSTLCRDILLFMFTC